MTLATICGIAIFITVMGLFFVISLVGIMASDSASTKVKDNSVFVIKLNGTISERSEEGTPFDALLGMGDMDAMGLDYNFHCLRHTYATYLLSNGVPLKFVQEQLGHSTPQTTLNVYNHVMPNVNFEAMNLLKNLQIEHKLNTIDNKIAES